MVKKLSTMGLICTLLCSLLTGCVDSSEVDDNIYVIAMGIDKGINNKLILTVLYPTYMGGPAATGGGGMNSSQAGPGFNIHSIEAPSVLEGINRLNMAISRRVSLSHTVMLVISEEFAKQGVSTYLAPIARFRETRGTMYMVVSRGKAVDFLKENKSNVGESVSKAVELMIAQSQNTGFFPAVNFEDFYRDVLSTYNNGVTAYAGVNTFQKLDFNKSTENPPLITEEDDMPGELKRIGVAKREFAGTAVFASDKMVGSLTPSETRYMLLIQGKFTSGIFTIEDKNALEKAIMLDIKSGRKPKISGHFENGKPVIDVKLSIEADIDSIQSRIHYEDTKMIENLNGQLKDHMQKDIKELIWKTQTEFNSDIFGFGTKLAGNFNTIQDWEKYKWLSHYKEAKVNVSLDVNIRRTGLMLRSAPVITESGETK